MNDRLSKNEKTLLAGLAFLTLYNASSFVKSRFKRLNEPPTIPFSLPIVGHTLYMILGHNKFIDWCSKNYGDMYSLNLFGEKVTVTGGKAGEETLKAPREDISIHQGVIVDVLHLDYILSHDTLKLGEDILPIIAKGLLPNSKMPGYLPSVKGGFKRAQKDMFNSNGPTYVSHPSTFLQNFVSYMSVPTLVGEEFKDNLDIIKSFAESTGDCVKNVPFYILFPRFMHPLFATFNSPGKKHTKIMEKYVEPVVHQYREDPNFGNKDTFIAAYSRYRNEDGEYLPSQQVAHSIILVAFASVHTTSRNVSATLYWLLARPELLKKLMDEIELVFPNNAPITHEALEKMTFLNDLLKEVLRQAVSNIGSRKMAIKDYTYYNGLQVPKGRPLYVTSRQMNFGLNMNRLGTDAMDPSKSMQKAITAPSRDYVSFGMGKHICPGRFFATQEIKFALIELLRNYEVKVQSGKRPIPYHDLMGMNPRNCEDPLVFTPRGSF
ncbi:cytochrome P450 [Backusella circina FSU 941]|nr:cytochrome P450 [Backusella circina FSU 941]